MVPIKREGEETMLGLFQTKGKNPESGLPNVVAIMFTEEVGISVGGGTMAAGFPLDFGESAPFDRSQWEIIATGEEIIEYMKEENNG